MTTYPGGSLLVENKVFARRANALSSQNSFNLLFLLLKLPLESPKLFQVYELIQLLLWVCYVASTSDNMG